MFVKKIYIFILILIQWNVLNAQNFISQDPGIFSELAYNPAIAGNSEDIVSMISVKRNWLNIKDAPATAILNIHSRLDNFGFSKPKKYISNRSSEVGLGLTVYSDKNGPLNNSGVQLSSSFHFSLPRDLKIAIGVAGKLNEYSLNQSVFKPLDNDDPMITWNKTHTINPNFNSGIWLYHKKYYIGISAVNLFEVNKSKDIFYNEISRTLFVKAGYHLTYNKTVIEPNILVNTFHKFTEIEFGIKLHFENNVQISISRNNYGFYNLYLLLKQKRFCFGYGFEYSTSPMYKYSYGNHEFIVGFNLF